MVKRIIDFIANKPEKIVYVSILFFLFAGLIYSFHLGNKFLFPDEGEYYTFAKNIAEGHGYTLDGKTPSTWRTPGYPLFLSLFIKIAGASPVFLRYLNFIGLALCVYFIHAILRRETARSGSGLSAMLLVLYGVLFYTAGTLFPQTICSLVIVLIIWVVTGPDFSYARAVIFGFLSAFMIMILPATIFIPPLVVLWMFFPNKYHVLWKAMVSALVVVACISIWAVRNYREFGEFIPLSTEGGINLYLGNNPNTDVMAWWKSDSAELQQKTEKLTATERNRFYTREAIKFWKESPASAIRLYLLKFLNYFNFRNTFVVASEFNVFRSVIMFLTYYPLLLCLIFRLFYIYKQPLSRVELLFVLLYFGSAFFYSIFIPRIRYRLPFDVLLIAHLGIIFSSQVDRMKRRQMKNLA